MRAGIVVGIGALLFLPMARAAAAKQAPSGESTAPLFPLAVTTSVPGDRFIDRHTPIEIVLNRSLGPDEGEIAVTIGATDVSALLERSGTTITYRPRLVPLPAGEREVIVYRHKGSAWVELQRFTLKVLRRGGLVRVSVAPSVTLGANGQLADGRSSGMPAPERRAFQDVTLTSALRSSHEAAAWAMETQSNIVGASRQEQALRFGQRGRDAPQLDLSDYLVTVRVRQTRLALGHVTTGTNRHLANGFGSRGVTVTTNLGPGTTVSLGALNGTAIVGWDRLLGLGRPEHRIMSATVASELVRRRPGALRLDVSVLDGSLLPQTAFAQGAVVDAERSAGVGTQMSASTSGQRLRLSGGYSRSRFTNPARDRELLGDSAVRRVRPETRGARYLEVTASLLQNRRVAHVGLASVSTGYRHEHVDPLYRSVAVGTQADRAQHAFDLTGNVGLIAGQLAHSWSSDNLDDVPSVLRTSTRQSTASLTVPLGASPRLKRVALYLPTMSYSANRSHQLAANLPLNGAFRPSDLPDQVSTFHNGSLQWQLRRWQLGYRFGASAQDNRQAERERADFATRTHAATLGHTLGSGGNVALDASSERQHAVERNETSRVQRIGITFGLRPYKATGVTANVGMVRSRDATRPKGSRNGDARVELSQSLPALGGARGTSRGQLFLRYGYTSAFLPAFEQFGSTIAARTQRQWTLSSGLNLRVF